MADKKQALPTKWITLGVIALIILILISTIWGSYNNFVKLDQNVNNAFANVQADYQRRLDLIPKLVNTVEGYAGFEKSTLTQVTALRTQWQTATTTEQKVATANQFEAALRTIIATSENYPDLKASANFIALQDSLEGTENRIAVARQRYNDAVREYNTAIKLFPGNIIAGMFGFSGKTYFESASGAANAPQVNIKIP